MSTFQKRHLSLFTDDERHAIVQEYLQGGVTKQALWHKYSGHREEHGQVLQMLRQFGYAPVEATPRSHSRVLEKRMKKRMKKDHSKPSESLVATVRNQYVDDLERELAETKLQLLMLKTLIELAEEEHGIEIKKNSGQQRFTE